MHSTEHVSQTVWVEPHMMNNMVILYKVSFIKTLWYIFLTEWQLCVYPKSPRVPRALLDWQLIAHMDPCIPETEAKLLAQLGVLVSPITLEQRDLILFMTGARLHCFILHQLWHPWSTVTYWQIHLNHGFWRSVCQRKHLWLGQMKHMLTEQARAGHVWAGDKVKRWNPSAYVWKERSGALKAINKAPCGEGCLNLRGIQNWGTDFFFALPHRSTHFCQEKSCAVCF